MPSSISNSDFVTASHRAPTGSWLWIWAAAIVLTTATLAGYEVFLRSHGHRPSIVDDMNLWAYHRGKIANNDLRTVVLIGASRIQLGFHTPTFRNAFPDHPLIHLAINGKFPAATLRDLANDEDFCGLVICSIYARGFMHAYLDEQQSHVNHYHLKRTVNTQFNTHIAAFVQNRLAFINPQVHLVKSVKQFIKTKAWPEPLYLITRSDRSRLADYTLLDIQDHRQKRLEKYQEKYSRLFIPSPHQWLNEAVLFEHWVRQIQLRGGQVVFVNFPMAHGFEKLVDDIFPKQQYWDQFAASTSAKTIHYQDYPALTGFDCPDGSHLDQRAAPQFTHALLNELVGYGLLSRMSK